MSSLKDRLKEEAGDALSSLLLFFTPVFCAFLMINGFAGDWSQYVGAACLLGAWLMSQHQRDKLSYLRGSTDGATEAFSVAYENDGQRTLWELRAENAALYRDRFCTNFETGGYERCEYGISCPDGHVSEGAAAYVIKLEEIVADHRKLYGDIEELVELLRDRGHAEPVVERITSFLQEQKDKVAHGKH